MNDKPTHVVDKLALSDFPWLSSFYLAASVHANLASSASIIMESWQESMCRDALCPY
jgi:hypothetical protein